jgi:predicted DNA-binding transcriptional regulator AlpA
MSNELLMLDTDEVERLIQKSVTRTMQTLQPTGPLWDMKQVAEYLSLTHLYVQNHWRKMNLPEPIRVGTGNQKPRLRWKSDEIRALF